LVGIKLDGALRDGDSFVMPAHPGQEKAIKRSGTVIIWRHLERAGEALAGLGPMPMHEGRLGKRGMGKWYVRVEFDGPLGVLSR